MKAFKESPLRRSNDCELNKFVYFKPLESAEFTIDPKTRLFDSGNIANKKIKIKTPRAR